MKLKVGEWYAIEFWDHMLDDQGDIIKMRVVGKVLHESKLYVRLAWWDALSTVNDDEETERQNQETVTIVRSAICRTKHISFS